MYMHSNIFLPGLEEAIILKTEVRENQYIIHFELPVTVQSCPSCQQETMKIHDYRWTKIKHLKFGERITTLFYRKRRYACACGKRFAEKNEIVDRYQRYSKEWNQMAQIRVVKAKTFTEIARQYGTSVSTMIRRFDRIIPASVKSETVLPKIIAIDEFKGNADKEKFQLIIADAVTKKPIDILPNRKKETLRAYLRAHGTKVEMVVMDMSHSFKAAVEEALDNPVIISDHFHFVRWIYWAMDRVRVRVQQDWHDYDRKKVKAKKYVFFKKPADLTEKDEWYLNRYFSLSTELKVAHGLKEQFAKWFETAKVNGIEQIEETKQLLKAFYEAVKEARIPEFERTMKTLQNWQTEILNSFAFPYSNGFVEGLNNLTKVIKRNAFGFRRFDRLRAKVLLFHQYKHIGNEIG